MIAVASTSSRGGVTVSSSVSSFDRASLGSHHAAAHKHQRRRGRTQRLNVVVHEQHDKSDNAEQQSPSSSSSNLGSSKDDRGEDDISTRFRESKMKSKSSMSDEDREEALEQMRELFIQHPKEGKVVNELVKQLRNYSRRDINKNNNAIKEALKALEVHNESVEEKNVSSGTLTTWAVLLEKREKL